MMYDLHKFCHYLLGNKVIFYVDDIVLYLVEKPHVSRRIVRWLLFFFKYDFLAIHKLGRSHFVVDALSQMFDIIEQNGILNQTTNVIFFFLQPVWLHENFKY
jgi:uncharacterized membrane protein